MTKGCSEEQLGKEAHTDEVAWRVTTSKGKILVGGGKGGSVRLASALIPIPIIFVTILFTVFTFSNVLFFHGHTVNKVNRIIVVEKMAKSL